jgi:adenylate cyclase
MKKHRLFYLLALLSTFSWALLQLFDPPLLRDYVESKTYDLRLRLRAAVRKQPLHRDILIVSIDEKSLAEMGRWPWRRDVMAGLVRQVAAGKPRVIGIDIVFSEPESAETDQALADAVRQAGNVVLATAFFVDGKDSPEEKGKVLEVPDYLWDAAFSEVRAAPGIEWRKWVVRASRTLPPVAVIAQAGVLGHASMLPDLDGVVRWELLSVMYRDDCYPSLALQVARLARGIAPNEMGVVGGVGIRLGKEFISTDLSGRVLINYRDREMSFPYLSAADVLAGRIPPGTFTGKVVLLGSSALATYDQKPTPTSASMPGVEKNATVVQNILLGNFIRKSPGSIELVVILLTGLFLTVVLPRLSAVKGVLLGTAMVIMYVAAACWLLIDRDLWINMVGPVLNMLFIFSTESLTKLYREEKSAREIRSMFSSYVSPKIVEVLINNPEKARLGGERREATILFSDMIGFTSLSERLPPEEVVTMLNDYYRDMAGIIFHWDGTLDKFVGDEIMAIWNAPADQPNHAELAVRCALDMSDRLDKLREEWRGKGKDLLDCGIGINTGEVIIGNIGLPGKKMDYTAIGNHVNIAARVEKLTREYHCRILVTGATWEAANSGRFGHITATEYPPVAVKGKEETVTIYSLASLPSD